MCWCSKRNSRRCQQVHQSRVVRSSDALELQLLHLCRRFEIPATYGVFVGLKTLYVAAIFRTLCTAVLFAPVRCRYPPTAELQLPRSTRTAQGDCRLTLQDAEPCGSWQQSYVALHAEIAAGERFTHVIPSTLVCCRVQQLIHLHTPNTRFAGSASRSWMDCHKLMQISTAHIYTWHLTPACGSLCSCGTLCK